MRLRAALASLASVALLTGLVVATSTPAQATETGLSATASSSWQTNNNVRAIAYANGKVYVGGEFTSVRPPGAALGTSETPRTYLAAFDANTGALITTWNPTLNGRVWSLAVSPDGSRLFVGGDFTSVNGSGRSRLAQFITSSGALDTTFRPSASFRVTKLATFGSTLYLVGSFTVVNGVTRNRAAAVNAATGVLLPFDPNVTSNPNAAVQTAPDVAAVAVSQDGTKVYLGGRFTTVGGVPDYGLAAVDATSGAPLSFPAQSVIPTPSPGCVSGIKNIITDSSTVYAAASGDGGGCYDGTLAANVSDGSLKWVNTCLGATETLAIVKGWLYKGSHAHDCSSAGAFPQSGNHFLLVESLSDGSIGPWFPQTNAAGSTQVGPLAFGTDGNQLFVGGDFTTVNGAAQQGLTRFAAGPETSPVKPKTPSAVSPQRGLVKVAFKATTDLDDVNLVYSLYRSGTTAPIATYHLSSTFWNIPSVQFSDSGLTPGAQVAYRVEATDGTAVITSSWTPYVTVASKTAAYPVVVASDAPNNYWRLDETAGTSAADIGLVPNVGTYANVLLGQTGALPDGVDKAVGFDGTTSAIRTASAAQGPQNFSVEAWIKTTTTTGGKIIGFGDSQTGTSGSYDRHIYMGNDGRLMFGVYNGNTNIVRTPLSYNDGQWHHVVGTFAPGTQALYVDGALQGTTTASSAQGFGGYWKIGGDNLNGWPFQPSSSSFAGTIDEVAVYGTALSLDAVDAHFLAGGGNFAPTASYTSSCTLLACTFDASASTDDGSIVGFAWNFGDGATATGATPAHTYPSSGNYAVTLTVTDNKGGTGSVTHTVTATPPPPADVYGQAVAADAPDVYWRLDEGGGNTAHDSGLTHNDGLMFGGVALGTVGAVAGTSDTAATFDGNGAGVGSTIAVSGPSVYSEEAWFSSTTTSGGKIIGFGDAQSGGSSNYDRHVYMTPNGNIAFGVWTGQTNIVTSPGTYNDGAWHHVVATQGADGMALFLDGALVGTNPQTQAQPYSGYWRVGGDSPWDGNAYFAGSIDEVAVYSAVLPANRVLAHYLTGKPPSAPSLVDDTISTAFQTVASQTAPGVLANDTGNGLTVTSHSAAGHGTVSVAPDGSFTYTPFAGFSGADSFTYTVTDVASQTATATANVTVAAPVAPTASDDSATTAYLTPVMVAAPGVLSNDGGMGLTVSSNTQPSHGAANVASDGAWSYSPVAGYAGTDSFSYTVTDAAAQTSTATVTVTVSAPPAPIATDDSGSTSLQTDLNVPAASGLLGNDSGSGISVISNTQPSSGSVTVGSNGAYTYSPQAGFVGTDSFSYTINDVLNRTATATVTMSVTSPAAPLAGDDTLSTSYQTAVSGNVLGNDSGAGITVTGSTNPAHGASTVAANGDVNYTPTGGYAGTDTFTYTITDVLSRTSTATVTVTITAPAAPNAGNDSLTTAFQTAVNGNVLGNDSGTGISVTGSTNPAHGTASVAPNGATTYIPASAFSGTDSFGYTITDALNRTATATVTVTVGAAPTLTIVNDSFTRTVAGGWGSAPTGGTWGPNNAALSVNGSVGVVSLVAGQSRSVFSTGAGAVRDVTATAEFSLDALPTGTGQYTSISLRRASTSVLTEYRGSVRVQSNGKVTALIYRLVSGSADVVVGAETLIPGITATAGQKLSFRFSATGTNPTTLRLTVWKTGTAEPVTPQVTATDVAAALQGTGLIGVTSVLSGSATAGDAVRLDNVVAVKSA